MSGLITMIFIFFLSQHFLFSSSPVSTFFLNKKGKKDFFKEFSTLH